MKKHHFYNLSAAGLLLLGPGPGPARAADETLAGLKAPPAAEVPWTPPDTRSLANELQAGETFNIDPDKEYELPELIDLAERANPETKAAWEQARAAAAAVRLAQSDYYPVLALIASGDWAKEPVPVPLTATEAGYFDAEVQSIQPVASLEWTLLDFGRRQSAVTAARDRLLAANLGFNARHQQIVFQVQEAFYELAQARERIAVATAAQTSADKVAAAAAARFQAGLGTEPGVAQAHQQAVAANFDLEEAQVAVRDAQVKLCERVGLLPTTPLRVADFSKLAMPTNLEDTVERVLDHTWSQRPDLLARVALLRARSEAVRHARADYLPKLSLEAEAGGVTERTHITVGGSALAWTDTTEPVWGIGLALSWPIFEGGARKSRVQAAQAESEAARHELENARNEAVAQVWQAYSDTKLAIHRLAVTVALVDASEKSYAQTFEAYENGLGNLVDLLQARTELSRARYAQIDTRAMLLKSTAALAYASGDLGQQLLEQKAGRHPGQSANSP